MPDIRKVFCLFFIYFYFERLTKCCYPSWKQWTYTKIRKLISVHVQDRLVSGAYTRPFKYPGMVTFIGSTPLIFNRLSEDLAQLSWEVQLNNIWKQGYMRAEKMCNHYSWLTILWVSHHPVTCKKSWKRGWEARNWHRMCFDLVQKWGMSGVLFPWIFHNALLCRMGNWIFS